MTNASNRLSTEIAHILFVDLVSYSKKFMEEQAQLVQELSQIVREGPEFQRAQITGDFISLDRGDGMALVFFRDPIAPVQCSIEIAHALGSRTHLQLRMGVNSGPVSRITDINGKENVYGDGMNMAQRIMDCGDTGHILLSQSIAEVLKQFGNWRDAVQDLGECEVKHGIRLRLFNLCREKAGNPAVPQKIKSGVSPPSTPASLPVLPAVVQDPAPLSSVIQKSPLTASAPCQITLVYKRNAPHSAYLLEMLETRLTEAGYPVFIDRHLKVGVRWAQELKHQIYASYAIIPLLSAESIWSEMLEDEILTAHEAAQQQEGKPAILPVRINYEGPIPDSFAHILDPLQYTLWQGPEDDARLLQEILNGLQAKPAARPIPSDKLEPVGGAVPLASEFYIERSTDAEFAAAMARQDSIVLVKGARQIGKTSLLARGLQQARKSGARCIRTDFQKLKTAAFESDDLLYLTLAQMITDELDLDVAPEETWNPRRLATVNFERFMRKEALASSDKPLVWALDEVDKLFTCSFGGDVFALFRSWHNDRSMDPDGPWSKLTLAIAYATEAHLFITDLNQSPFNVGTRLTLDDFTMAQVGELNRRYGSPLRSMGEVDRFHHLVGGQPYLVRRGLDEMVTQRLTLEALEANADQDEGVFGDHLRRLLVSLSQDPEMMEVVRQMLQGQRLPSSACFFRLRSGGLLAGSSEGDYRLRCRLYGQYLERHLQ